MSAMVLAAALAAATYTPPTSVASRTVVGLKTEHVCYPAAPELSVAVQGPGPVALLLFVDLPSKPRKPTPLRVTISVDGKGKPTPLNPKRGKGRYVGVEGEPSEPVKPNKLVLADGAHTLTIAFPKDRSGCVSLVGITPAAPAPSHSPAAAALSPPPVAPTASGTASESAPTPSPTVVEEIHATQVGDAGASPPPAEASTRALGRDKARLRLGAFWGGVLPRAGLKPAMSLGLLLEVPLGVAGVPSHVVVQGYGIDIMGHFTFAWSPLRQQAPTRIDDPTTLGIPHGQGNVIQRTHVFPLELGATARADLGWPVQPYAGIALAADIVRTEFEVFGRTYDQNDFSVGFALRAGCYLPLGPGGALAEILYREVGSDIGSFAAVGESTLAVFNLHLGYALTF